MDCKTCNFYAEEYGCTYAKQCPYQKAVTNIDVLRRKALAILANEELLMDVIEKLMDGSEPWETMAREMCEHEQSAEDVGDCPKRSCRECMRKWPHREATESAVWGES